MRYADHLSMDVSERAEIDFPDASEVSGFAKDAMSWAVAEGLFTGDDVTGELNPTDGAARGGRHRPHALHQPDVRVRAAGQEGHAGEWVGSVGRTGQTDWDANWPLNN